MSSPSTPTLGASLRALASTVSEVAYLHGIARQNRLADAIFHLHDTHPIFRIGSRTDDVALSAHARRKILRLHSEAWTHFRAIHDGLYAIDLLARWNPPIRIALTSHGPTTLVRVKIGDFGVLDKTSESASAFLDCASSALRALPFDPQAPTRHFALGPKHDQDIFAPDAPTAVLMSAVLTDGFPTIARNGASAVADLVRHQAQEIIEVFPPAQTADAAMRLADAVPGLVPHDTPTRSDPALEPDGHTP